MNDPVNFLTYGVKSDSSAYSLSYSSDGNTWSPAYSSVKIDSTKPGSYSIYIRQTVASTPACANFSTFSVVILPKPPPVAGVRPRFGQPADPANRTIFVCEAYPYNLNDSVNGPAPGYQLKWMAMNASGDLVPFSGAVSRAIYSGQDTMFFVQNYSKTACSGAFDTIHVSVLPLPLMKNSPSDYQVCETKPVTFTALDVHTGNNPTYDWYLNDTLRVSKGGPGYTLNPNPYKAGQKVLVWYVVHISSDAPYYHCDSIGPPSGGTFVSDTISVKILPRSKVPGPVIGPDIVYEGQKNTFYKVPLDTALVYSWRFSNPNDANINFANNTVIVNYRDSLVFPANNEIIDTLVLTVHNNCDSIHGYLLIHIRPYLKPINILTPNGDNINDRWIIYNIENAAYINNQVMIYDRYGNLVYKTSNYTNTSGWDGTYNGRPLAEGTYYYIILFKEDNYTRSLKGYINILRK